jgi:myo-inositol-1(or 4)-monophosphatase
MSRSDDLGRIRAALEAAATVLRSIAPDRVTVRYKEGDSPVTDADLAVDEMLRRTLPAPDEGWLSEESADDRARLARRRVWVVDPLDGTREFLEGVPHWSISIALIEDGVAVAGGIFNPSTDELVLGAAESGVTLNGAPVHATSPAALDGATVVVSRWAVHGKRARRWADVPFTLRPIGPIAYALALVACGRADALWSRSPKPEWDVAAGTALIAAAGGRVSSWDGSAPRFNRWPPSLGGIVVSGAGLHDRLRAELAAGRVPA